MAEIRRTFIPQFTVRWILAFTAVMAVVSLVAALAVQGAAWAAGITIGLAALAVTFAVYAAMFAGVGMFGRFLTSLQSRRDARRKREDDQVLASANPAVKPINSTDKAIRSGAKALLLVLVSNQLILQAGMVWAASGGSITLPQPGTKTAAGPQTMLNPTGLSLTINTAWVDSSGYRPVRISVKSLTGPVKADRVLTVTFRPMQGYTRNESVAVTQTVEIPAGSASAEATLSVPQLCPWGMFTLDVYEDGEYLKQLSIPENGGWTSWSGTPKGDSASPVILLLSGVDKISRNFLVNPSMELIHVAPEDPTALIDPQIASAAATPVPAYSTASPTMPSSISSPADLPTRWIDYSGCDVMLVSLDKLKILTKQHPAQWQAICDWLHNGGTLIIYETGKRWSGLSDLEGLVCLNDSSGVQVDEADPSKSGWELPRESLRDQSLVNAGAANGGDQTPEKLTPANQAPFITRRCGLGLVAAIPSEQSLGSMLAPYPWNWLFNTIGPQRWQWSQRWGVSLYQSNDDFWNFLIPGVGLVPVLQFQVLITLFVVLLGPVNYYLLRHWGKLNLTVLTVPAGALLITGGLLLYALVEDGLSVRVRARSFTHIDQRSGEATCWTRLSYYAGLAPSGGLTFTNDTAVIPLDSQALATEDQPRRTLDWQHSDRSTSSSPLEQRLTDGWLYSRTPTQFITARIRKCTERLEVHPAASGQPPKVLNRLGTPIKRLFLVDESGACCTATDVATDATVPLQTAESQSAVFLQQLQPMLEANRSGPIVGVADRNAPSFFGFSRERQYPQRINAYGRPVATYGPPDYSGAVWPVNAGILDRSLADMWEQLMNNSLPPRTYVAVVDSSPEVQWGTPAARPEESLHVIVGQW